jgi:hypothetical protein
MERIETLHTFVASLMLLNSKEELGSHDERKKKQAEANVGLVKGHRCSGL